MSTAVNLSFGLTPFLDNFAHAGGLICGFAWGMATFPLSSQGSCLEGCMCNLLSKICAVFILITTLTGIVFVFTDSEIEESVYGCEFCHTINCLETPWWDCETFDNSHGPCEFIWQPGPSLLSFSFFLSLSRCSFN